MRNEPKFEVALAKEACCLCGKLVDGPIIMNTRTRTGRDARKVKEAHGQCIGYLDHPCDSCQDQMEKGFLLIEVDEEKTADQNNPWRTGRQFVIHPDQAKEIFDDVGTKGAAFLTIEAARKLGIPDEAEPGLYRKEE